ncbi:hypothetical protein BCR44DRAFT_1427294 [Catenaria anguillulae PL171]|uniref:Uncharacterized protein n=1 Tax=Catenaria anguillulae PL171 TaxID=765915 RepID=A0A1Y2HYW6_9FUNG|nr:hypothetical protein BCR44DRAFT_1427294 [Catenaria anguillulae PL171]
MHWAAVRLVAVAVPQCGVSVNNDGLCFSDRDAATGFGTAADFGAEDLDWDALRGAHGNPHSMMSMSMPRNGTGACCRTTSWTWMKRPWTRDRPARTLTK